MVSGILSRFQLRIQNNRSASLLFLTTNHTSLPLLRGSMKIEYQETTSDLQTRIDIHGKYGGRDIDAWMLDLLKLQKGARILDVGCGSGKQCFSYHKYLDGDAEIHGGDVNMELLNQAIEANKKIGSPVHFREVNFNEPFPYESGQF